MNAKILTATHLDVFSNLFLAWFLQIIGIFFNAILWNHLGYGWIGVLLSAIGIAFDLAKIRLLKNSVNAYRGTRYGLGTFFATWFVIMTCLSMFAAAGFYAMTLTETQTKAALSTEDYQQAVERVNQAQALRDQNAAFALLSPHDLQKQRETEIQAILNGTAKNMNGQTAGVVGSLIGDCSNPRSYYVRQFCPQIQAVKDKYDPQIKGAQDYQAAVIRLQTARAEKAKAASNVSVGIPIFGLVGTLLHNEGKTQQQAEQDAYMGFVITTAVITELLASVLFIAAFVFGNATRPTFEQIRAVKMAEIQMQQEFAALQQLEGYSSASLPKPSHEVSVTPKT